MQRADVRVIFTWLVFFARSSASGWTQTCAEYNLTKQTGRLTGCAACGEGNASRLFTIARHDGVGASMHHIIYAIAFARKLDVRFGGTLGVKGRKPLSEPGFEYIEAATFLFSTSAIFVYPGTEPTRLESVNGSFEGQNFGSAGRVRGYSGKEAWLAQPHTTDVLLQTDAVPLEGLVSAPKVTVNGVRNVPLLDEFFSPLLLRHLPAPATRGRRLRCQATRRTVIVERSAAGCTACASR